MLSGWGEVGFDGKGVGGRPLNTAHADICLVLEGAYPFIVGGVSHWTHALIRELPDLTFHLLTIQPQGAELTPRYPRLPNITGLTVVSIPGPGLPRMPPPGQRGADLADVLERLIMKASADDLAKLGRRLTGAKGAASDPAFTWDITRKMYERLAPDTSFPQFFWIWHALFGSLAEVLSQPLPDARIYHAISTGYAGLFAARAKIETGVPVLLTEHGIYTHERFVELMSSEQLHDSFVFDDFLTGDRDEARDVWLRAFESFAQLCYDASDRIITLSGIGSEAQISLGADPARAMIIPNGIDVDRFSAIPLRRRATPPRIGLIGRVVAIKDVETYIRAAGILASEWPDLEAWVIGPLNEEPEYYEDCAALVKRLGLEDRVIFKGMQDVTKILSEVDMIVLTSISEAQPLTLLEAGAAGLPCIATDVGSCREILFGGANERPSLGIGGAVTDLISPGATAAAIAELLRDRRKMRARGRSLKKRVETYYRQEQMIGAYSRLYGAFLNKAETAQESGT